MPDPRVIFSESAGTSHQPVGDFNEMKLPVAIDKFADGGAQAINWKAAEAGRLR
jgi:hypothetical protein